jgi:seryl-tRNA(Sec) selenium transferase
MSQLDIRTSLGLRSIINVFGTMTALGASIMVLEAIKAMAATAPHFVEIDELQKKASTTIARLCSAHVSPAPGAVSTVEY